MKLSKIAATSLTLAVLAGCGERELILAGERFGLREPLPEATETGESVAEVAPDALRQFVVPAEVNHDAWTHRNGNAQHLIAHPALANALSLAWTANIGEGNSRRQRITADPIVSGGRIFTLDSSSTVTATGSDGSTLWSRELVPGSDKERDASGGGIAFGDSAIFVTTGFGELFAINADSGEIRWQQKLEAPLTAAPTVDGKIVYVVSRDSRAWALDTEFGRIKWQVPGAPSSAVMLGGSGPAVAGRVVVFPFGSGEVSAALKSTGIRVWGSAVAGQRRGRAYSNISDVTSDPVVAGDVIYAANQGGRVVAMKASSGERLWSANEGAYSPVWPADDSVFLISDQAELVRLDAATGERIWGVELPYFKQERLKRRKRVFAHFGPILAGGRLIVASDDGQIRQFNPEDGALLGATELRGGAASNPVVVNRTLYIVTENGQLAAFR